ncbi:alpha/beta fold hydrolase [Siculibacillus lacustris]|uniref:Alpha/beta fold hydrolase n=1 Tax=Siculibacillus lacustris TaxID=1549641 RepID=A0A4Q9VXC5_9HYPH|nr:alpha/beta hydrolase [Siculibacillus lacustris]TBW40931.1 alpha/beta fold hydrolase [Siculibacillus lacustris]
MPPAAAVSAERSADTPRRRAVRLASLVVALGLAACGGRSETALLPTTLTAEGTSRVDMLVATTRAATGKPEAPYTGERGAEVSLDRFVVSIPPEAARKVGEIQWPETSPADPAKSFAVLEDRRLTKPEAVAWFHRSGSRRMLVFVHGFNTRYDEAVFRFAQLVHDSGTDFVPVLFSWPSRGSVWAYAYDRESTIASRDALESVLRGAAADPAVSDVTVLAHSMGGWLAVEALRQMAIREGKVPSKIGNLILASPDLDVDVFRGQIARIGRSPRVTLFVSRDDRALELSKRLAGGVDRLGAIDPSTEPARGTLEKAGVTVLDLTALRTGDNLNHGKFAQSPEIVRLLGQRLIAGQSVTDSQVGLGDRLGAVALGAAGTVGSAASFVVTAPIAVFDPQTRSGLGERGSRVGEGLFGTFDPLLK